MNDLDAAKQRLRVTRSLSTARSIGLTLVERTQKAEARLQKFEQLEAAVETLMLGKMREVVIPEKLQMPILVDLERVAAILVELEEDR